MSLEEKIAQCLINGKKTLSLAESCTGGRLADLLTNVSGSSKFFKLGVIVYSNEAKVRLLKIRPVILKKHGAVSEQVAQLMARQVRRLQKTDFGIAITGIAGPTGGTSVKPVGLTYIAVAAKEKTLCLKYVFPGNRSQVKTQAARRALKMLFQFL